MSTTEQLAADAAMYAKALRAMSNGPTLGISMPDSAILQNAADFIDSIAAAAQAPAAAIHEAMLGTEWLPLHSEAEAFDFVLAMVKRFAALAVQPQAEREAVLVAALERIARWVGEFPETGKYWDEERTRPMSYSGAYGSNGERDYMRAVARAALAAPPTPAHDAQAPAAVGRFKLGDRVAKVAGSSWTGLVVGTYSTSLTPEGYAVESENEPGSVQIYPAKALAATPAPQAVPPTDVECWECGLPDSIDRAMTAAASSAPAEQGDAP